MPGPLAGVKVIDLTAVLLGPFATQHLADMGADVIKVEPPDGDLLRVSGGSMGRDKGMGPIYMAANRNKRSLCLDLKKPAAVAVLKDLTKDADLFIHNSRPAAIERLGLGYDDLKKVNPSIIYAYSLGYARKGPYGHKPAFDDLVQGVSGAASLQSRVDGQPPKFIPSLIADKTTGLHLCIAVLGALYHRKCTGEGQMIEVPMLETLASFWLTEHLFGATWRPERGAMGYDRIINKYRHPFPTRNGYVCALPYTDAHWVAFFDIVERPDLAKDPRFQGMANRLKNVEQYYATLAGLCAERTNAEWVELLKNSNVPHGPVNTLDDLFVDPQLNATGYWQDVEHPSEGRLRMPGIAPRFSKTQPEITRLQPRLGEHSVEVLKEAGFTGAEIDAMLKSGATKSE